MMEIKGLENSIPIRKIYIDNKETVNYKSLCHASRETGVKIDTIKNSLSPLKKKRFIDNNREFVFRIIKTTT
jgi:hypothetical protein